MTRTWQVENTWNCPSCSTLNKGRDLSCRNCGARKGAEVVDNVADPGNVVTDPELLKKATAGPNWKCGFCGGQERNGEGACSNCAGARPATKAEKAAEFVKFAERVGGLPTSAMAASELPNARIEDGSLLPWWRLKLHRVDPFHFKIGLVLLSVAAAIWFVVWLLTPRVVDARVTDIAWNTTTNLRARQTFHDAQWGRPGGKGFYHEPAFNVSCQRKYYGEEQCHPHDCNPHSVSYDCNCRSYDCGCYTTCSDNGNGFSTCSERCSTCTSCSTCSRTEYDTCWDSCPVYKDWCEYDAYDWPVKASKTDAGHDHAVHWPLLAADGPLERVERKVAFQVNLEAGKERLSYVPADQLDFDRFNVGDRWRVKVGRIGGGVTPVKKLP